MVNLKMTEQEALDCHEKAQELQAEGRHAEAAAGFEKAVAYFAEAEGPRSPDLANVLDDYAESLLALCRYEDAERAARQASEIVSSLLDLLVPRK